MNRHDLLLRIRALAVRPRVERELDEELAFHLERETRKHIDAGVSAVEARRQARLRFGPVSLAADQCRDARGTDTVDRLVRDVDYAFRTFRRMPLAALTIVATVALGLGLVATVFTIYNFFFLRVDAVRNPGELFAVSLTRTGSGNGANPRFTQADYEALRRETRVFTDAFAMSSDVGSADRIEQRPARGALVTGNFFQVLGVHAALGRTLLPGDDEASGQPVIVLSDTGWRKLLDGDRSAIGRSVVMNGAQFEIAGVMPEEFRGLGLTPPDYWAPLSLAPESRKTTATGADETAIEVVGRLAPGMSPAAATAALDAWASRRSAFDTFSEPPMHVRLTPRQGTLSVDQADAFFLFGPLFFAFGLVLMIGCANVANLLLARGLSRQREIGIRMALGAPRRRIVRQLLTESLLLALAAAGCGIVISRLFLQSALRAVVTTIPPDFGLFASYLNLEAPGVDWRVLLFLLASAVVSTAFFGLAPALQATRLDLVRTMRGEVTRDARPGRARRALIGIQVGASTLLLICAVIFLRGAIAHASQPPDIRMHDTVRVSIETESERAAVLRAVTADPLVAAVSAASPTTRGILETSLPPGSMPVNVMAVSPGYLDVLGITIVSGRGFTRSERAVEAGVAVVSETIARQLWPNGNGVGQTVRIEPLRSASRVSTASTGAAGEPSRPLTVVGIVRDPVHDAGMGLASFRGVYVSTALETPKAWLYLRVRGNPELARQALLGLLTGLDPAFGILTLRAMAGMQTYLLEIGFWIAVVLGALALVLTVSGLFSVLSYVIEQRAREIGTRLALGAATRHVAGFVLSLSFGPVATGLVTGGAVAAAVATVLMATPAASDVGGWIDVFDPVAYIASALVIAAGCLISVSVPTLRATRLDPIATLRTD